MPTFNNLTSVGAPFNDPDLLRLIYTNFCEDIEYNHLLIFDTGVCMEMQVWNNYAFHVRDFGSPRSSCLVFRLQPVGKNPDPQRHQVRIFNPVTEYTGNSPPSAHMVLNQMVITKALMDASLNGPSQLIQLTTHNNPQ